jgi:glycosyltransferase involved in cell wall biosynthesis
MSKHWDLEILTSCAVDYTSWANDYPSGLSQVNQVQVRRFPVDYPRTSLLFNRWSDLAFSTPVSRKVQDRWMTEQGPYSSEFKRYLQTHQKHYDVVFFFTYLYAFTWFGLPLVADRSILIPTAHDEPSFHLPFFRDLFSLPRAFLFQTPEEQKLVQDKFHISAPSDVVSTGIDLPEQVFSSQNEETLRQKVQGDYVLYLGRIEESKGCRELFEYFIQYRRDSKNSRLKLVLAGKAVMPVPDHPDIVSLGFVSEEFKGLLLSRAQALVMPSPYESLSLVTLEAWAAKVPVLVNRRSIVLQGQCDRSGGGLTFQNNEEFITHLNQLMASVDLRKRLGQNGFEYVSRHYLWDQVEKDYMKWANQISQG